MQFKQPLFNLFMICLGNVWTFSGGDTYELMDEESDKKPVIDPSKRPLPPRPTDNQDHDGSCIYFTSVKHN